MGSNAKNHCFHLSRWVATLVRDCTWITRQNARPAPHLEVFSPKIHFYHSEKLQQQRRCNESSNNWSQMTAVSFLSRLGAFFSLFLFWRQSGSMLIHIFKFICTVLQKIDDLISSIAIAHYLVLFICLFFTIS